MIKEVESLGRHLKEMRLNFWGAIKSRPSLPAIELSELKMLFSNGRLTS